MNIFINRGELSRSQDNEKDRIYFDKLYADNNLTLISEKIDFLENLKRDMIMKNRQNISRVKHDKAYTRIEDEIIRLEEDLRHKY